MTERQETLRDVWTATPKCHYHNLHGAEAAPPDADTAQQQGGFRKRKY